MRGAMPQDVIELRAKLPGVGPYTAAAVASIAYNQPVGAVDGNVIRVFSRYFFWFAKFLTSVNNIAFVVEFLL